MSDKVSWKSTGRADVAGSPGSRCRRQRHRAVKVQLREPECNAALNCFSRIRLLQSRPTLCDPMHCSLPGSSVHGSLQARILEWVATPFSRGSS